MYIYIIIAFILIMISLISGQSAAPSGSVGSKNCAECKADLAWYASLKKNKKVIYAAWWVARKIACAANGC